MTNLSPLSNTVTFDDLLKTNKQQFDRVFALQSKELGLLATSHRPPTSTDLASASLASETPAEDSDVYAMLNRRFGSHWSSEVVEHKVERGAVTVLGKLTVEGSSKMQFGSARANGDEGAALRRAMEAALRGCAEMFAETAPATRPSELPAGKRPLPERTTGGASGREVSAEPMPRGRERPRLGTGSLDLVANALRDRRH